MAEGKHFNDEKNIQNTISGHTFPPSSHKYDDTGCYNNNK